ncbi:1-phosphofructokinase family hexose kinase [Corynebacterium sp. S7]
MILTFTPNPSIDATLGLDEQLTRGAVLRPTKTQRSAGGKGINVAHALYLSDTETLAFFPAAKNDPFIALVTSIGMHFEALPIDGNVRTNTAITEPDGTTTKLNEPGATLSSENILAIEKRLASLSHDADIVVLAGSLPPGAPKDWYATLVELIHRESPGTQIAVDTSDQPLQELGSRFPGSAPTIIKPNGLELGQLTGHDGLGIEKSAKEGDFAPALSAAEPLLDQGVQEIVLTLGGAGALLITAEGAWAATPPPTKVVSTVGAGDCSLAGYLIARQQGLSSAECLRSAVAYGSAATSLPGTQIPTPDLVNFSETTVSPVSYTN